MKLDNGNYLYFAENHRNREVLGLFRNSPFLYFNGIPYKCWVSFGKNELIISDLIRCAPGTDRIIEHLFKLEEGQAYHRQPVSWYEKQLIRLNMNTHSLSYKKANAKRIISIRQRTFFSFLIAVLCAVSYLCINLLTGNKVMVLIRENVYVQSFLIFLSVIGVLKIWRPFSIKKTIDRNDIERIAQEVIDRNREEQEIEDISCL